MFTQRQELFKVSPSTKKMQVWKAWTCLNKVHCQWGELNGKLQVSTYEAEPKNTGRSNATTAVEQAQVELQAMYQAQLDNKHYKLSQIEAIESSEVCRIPRKVTNYKDRKDKMPEVLLTQTKFNGSRACVIDGQLFSKIGRHEEIKVTHLRDAVKELHAIGCATFDAEVYAHGLSLQRIRSAWLKPVKTSKEIIKIAKDKAKKRNEVILTPDGNVELKDAIDYLGYNPNDDALQLKFYVFDIPTDRDTPFTERIEDLAKLEELTDCLRGSTSCFKFVYPTLTKNQQERLELRNEAVSHGYEGLVHYVVNGVYEFGKRSTNTAKDKPRYDSEALVVEVTKDKGGDGVLHCVACDELDNVKFKCKMKVERRDGKRHERDYETMLDLVGKWITFSYEELSGAGVPTKPVGEMERLCDSQGRPLE